MYNKFNAMLRSLCVIYVHMPQYYLDDETLNNLMRYCPERECTRSYLLPVCDEVNILRLALTSDYGLHLRSNMCDIAAHYSELHNFLSLDISRTSHRLNGPLILHALIV